MGEPHFGHGSPDLSLLQMTLQPFLQVCGTFMLDFLVGDPVIQE